MKRSILTEKIARRGYHIYREYGIDPLERHFVEEVMTKPVQWIDASWTAAEALQTHFGPHQAHRAFPVARDGKLVGIVDRVLLAGWAGQAGARQLGELLAGEPPRYAMLGENCRSVASRMARDRVERLPVVRDADSLELVGIIARSDLIKPSVIHFEEEEQRERLLGLPWRSEP